MVFGNRELLYRDNEISCLDPIPVRPRPAPPVIPHMTAVGKPLEPGKSFVPNPQPAPAFGTVGLIDAYESIYPMSALSKIAALRIIQVLPKTTPNWRNPQIGCGSQKSARMVLGTVPVEDDGGAWFNMPAGRPVYFQALDADGVAVQSMRSAAYVHPGETLTCIGCHNPTNSTYAIAKQAPKAMRRPPSEIRPEPAGSKPFNYPILVQPVLDKNCVECHQKSMAEGKKAPDLSRGANKVGGGWFASYHSLRNFTFFWNHNEFDINADSKPGQIGARASKLYQMLVKGHHELKLGKEDLHRLTLWMDCNCDYFGAYEKLEDQNAGKIVWPSLE